MGKLTDQLVHLVDCHQGSQVLSQADIQVLSPVDNRVLSPVDIQVLSPVINRVLSPVDSHRDNRLVGLQLSPFLSLVRVL